MGRMCSEYLFPAGAAQYRVPASSIRVIDAFVVKYTASLQSHLPVHTDQSQFSMTVALNGPDQYNGGGTYFVDLDRPLNCAAGGVISFEGALAHGGHPITRGTRYIIALFLYSRTEADTA